MTWFGKRRKKEAVDIPPKKKASRSRIARLWSLFHHLALILLFLVVLAVFLVLLNVRQIGMYILSRELNRPVVIENVSLDFYGRFTISNVRITNPSWAAEPDWITAESVTGSLDIDMLREGIVYFRSLRVERPRFFLQIMPDGRTNLPEGRPDSEKDDTSPGPSVKDIMMLLQSDKVSINDGSFRMIIPGDQIELTVASITIQGIRKRGVEPQYNARCAINEARMRLEDILDVTASLQGESLDIDSSGVRLTGQPLIVSAGKKTTFRSTTGFLRNYAYPWLSFDVTSTISLEDIHDCLFFSFPFEGDARLEGHLEGLADELIVKAGLLMTQSARVTTMTVNRLRSTVRYQDGRVYFSDLDARLYSGNVRGTGWLQFLDDIRFSLVSTIHGINIQSLLSRFDVALPLDATIDGNISLAGNDFEVEDLAGEATLTCTIKPPISRAVKVQKSIIPNEAPPAEEIKATASFRSGRLQIADCSGMVASTMFSTAGSLSMDGDIALTYDLSSDNVTDAVRLVDRFITQPDKKKERNPPRRSSPASSVNHGASVGQDTIVSSPDSMISGRGGGGGPMIRSPQSLATGMAKVRGSVSGTLSDPSLDVNLDFESGSLYNIPVRSLSTHVLYEPGLLTVQQFTATMKRTNARLAGWLDLDSLSHIKAYFRDGFTLDKLNGFMEALPAFSLTANVTMLDLERLSTIVSELPPLSGELDFTCDLSRKDSPLTGELSAIARNVTIAGETIFQTSLSTSAQDQKVNLDRFSLILFDVDRGYSEVRGKGNLTFSGDYSFSFETEHFDSRHIIALQESFSQVSGILAGSLTGQGSLSSPKLAGEFTLYDLHFQGNRLGLGTASFSLDGSLLTASLNLHEQQIAADCALDFGTSTIESGMVTLNNSNYLPFLSLIGLDDVAGLVGRGTGTITAKGSYEDLRSLLFSADFELLVFGLDSYPLQNRDTVHGELREGVITINPVTMEGKDSEIYLSGAIDIIASRFNLGAEGRVNLVLPALIEPEIKYSAGSCTFGINVEGPFDAPYVYAEASIREGALILTSLPVEFDNITASLILKNRRISLTSLRCSLGTGTIQVSGDGYLPLLDEHFDPFKTKLDLKVTAQNCELDYPDGFYGLVSSTMGISGILQQPFLAGKVIVHSGDYEQKINIRSLLIETVRDVLRSRPFFAAASEVVGFNPGFNLVISNEQPLTLSSDDVNCAYNLDLYLYGDLAVPKMQGNVTLTEGEVYFDERTITITSGVVSFLNPLGIYPTLNIVGESTIENYQVQITVSGEYPDILLSFSSADNLTKNEILSLVLFGTADVSSGDVGRTESLRFASDILLENEIFQKVKQLFSISKFQLAPIWVTEGTGSGVRMQLTVGTEILGGYITYTKTGETTDYDIITAEWELSRRLVIEFLRDRDRSFGGDIRLKFPFP